MKILLSGFEPFGGREINASWELVRDFPRKWRGYTVYTVRVPCVHGKAWETLRAVAEEFHPDVLISFGEAGTIPHFNLERSAVNWREFPIPDNSGAQIQCEPIVPGAPPAYFSGLPLSDIHDAIKALGLPVKISLASATAYLCNELFFCEMDYAASRPGLRAGFVHVPVRLAEGAPEIPPSRLVGAILSVVAPA